MAVGIPTHKRKIEDVVLSYDDGETRNIEKMFIMPHRSKEFDKSLEDEKLYLQSIDSVATPEKVVLKYEIEQESIEYNAILCEYDFIFYLFMLVILSTHTIFYCEF